jgi:uncharacterized repeat protein (TIGR03803 family)
MIAGLVRRFGALTLLLAGSAAMLAAQTYSTLFTFPCSGVDGAGPDSAPVQDSNGILYGTTYLGGNASGGTIYSITTGGVFRTAYDICMADGQCPLDIGPYEPVVEATNGRLYGTTLGTAEIEGNPGAIFVANGGQLALVHFFCSEPGCADGYNPGGMIQASDGDLYGIAANGGQCSGGQGGGTVFKVTQAGDFSTVYTACPPLGGFGAGELIQATDGNFYGGIGSGVAGQASIFQLTPEGDLTTLYTFCTKPGCPDGTSPNNLVQAADGNLYGTTQLGGSACPYNLLGCGTAFRITLEGVFTTLHKFCESGTSCPDGGNPSGELVPASDGNLYGTAGAGGATGQGTVFKMTTDGEVSAIYNAGVISLMQDTDGDFYGTAGPDTSCGTIFSLSAGLPSFVSALPAAARVGATVRILGTTLTGATGVSFAGTAATFRVVSPSEITATVPAGASSGKIEVLTPGGTLSTVVPFTILP